MKNIKYLITGDDLDQVQSLADAVAGSRQLKSPKIYVPDERVGGDDVIILKPEDYLSFLNKNKHIFFVGIILKGEKSDRELSENELNRRMILLNISEGVKNNNLPFNQLLSISNTKYEEGIVEAIIKTLDKKEEEINELSYLVEEAKRIKLMSLTADNLIELKTTEGLVYHLTPKELSYYLFSNDEALLGFIKHLLAFGYSFKTKKRLSDYF